MNDGMIVQRVVAWKVPQYCKHTGELVDLLIEDSVLEDIEIESFAELLDLLDDCPHASQSAPYNEYTWASGYDSFNKWSYETGGEIATSLHYEQGNKPRYLKYWLKALALKTL